MISKRFIVGVLLASTCNLAAALAPITPSDQTVKVEEASPVVVEGVPESADTPNVIIGKKDTESTPLVAVDNKIVTTDNSSQPLAEQVGYLNQQHLPEKMQQLQQLVQDLKGLVEIQGHQIEQLKKQISDFYADLDNRLEQGGKPKVATENLNTETETTTLAPKNTSSNGDEASTYQSAFQYVKSKKYSEAIQAFKGYLKQYPNGQFAGESHFWLGELYTLSGKNAEAKTEFMIVVNRYPHSLKISDALLKLGSIAYDQQAYAEAKMWWNKLVKTYPDTAAARVAAERLKTLRDSAAVEE